VFKAVDGVLTGAHANPLWRSLTNLEHPRYRPMPPTALVHLSEKKDDIHVTTIVQVSQ
jgi:hypothetical protein